MYPKGVFKCLKSLNIAINSRYQTILLKRHFLLLRDSYSYCHIFVSQIQYQMALCRMEFKLNLTRMVNNYVPKVLKYYSCHIAHPSAIIIISGI